jgi:hypothetical protein
MRPAPACRGLPACHAGCGTLAGNCAAKGSTTDLPPRLTRPRLIAFELRDAKYEQTADVRGDDSFRAMLPFPVTIRPAVLVRTGPLD